MKVKSDKCNIGLNGERYAKGEVFEVDESTGKRLLAQRTAIRVDVPEPEPVEVKVKVTEIKPEKSVEEEFKKVGGRWRKTKTKEQSP